MHYEKHFALKSDWITLASVTDSFFGVARNPYTVVHANPDTFGLNRG